MTLICCDGEGGSWNGDRERDTLGGSSMVRMSYERHESVRRARTSTCVARAPIHRSDRLGRIDGRRTALEEADRHKAYCRAA